MIKLHIGGTEKKDGWTIVDVESRSEVDIVANALYLPQFENESVDVIYASHVLEHFHYLLNTELELVLKEWHRILKPDGQLMISVPDMEKLCWLWLSPNISLQAKHHIMRIIFGGQTGPNDVHFVGFDYSILAYYLGQTGFTCERVSEFGLFRDSSLVTVGGHPISLNMLAVKPS